MTKTLRQHNGFAPNPKRSLALVSLFGWAGLAAACGHEAKPANQYQLVFHLADDRDHGLPDIAIRVGHTGLGVTDLDGVLRAKVKAYDGQRFALDAPCPSGHEAVGAPAEVVFLNTKGLEGKANAKIEVRLVCKRNLQVAALLVHVAGLEGFPILVDGVQQGTTGPGGFSHLRLEGGEKSEFEISIDTGASPSLVPKNPRFNVRLGGKDDIFVFEPTLSTAEPVVAKPKRVRRRRKKPAPPNEPVFRRPVRID